MQPYYRTDQLKPGLRWGDMSTAGKYREHYVQLDDGPIPVGVMIARELMDAGASAAVCTDLTLGNIVLLGPDLVCTPLQGELGRILEELFAANGNRWSGLPDAVAVFPDGRVALREAKVAKKDRLNKNQHDFARAALALLGDRLDLAVVEWGREAAGEPTATVLRSDRSAHKTSPKRVESATRMSVPQFLSLTPVSTIPFFQEMIAAAERRGLRVEGTRAGLKIYLLGSRPFLYCYLPSMYKQEASVLEIYVSAIKGTPLAEELGTQLAAIAGTVKAGQYSWRIFVSQQSAQSARRMFKIAMEAMGRQDCSDGNISP